MNKQYEHYCTPEQASKMADWLTHRGGLAIWGCVHFGHLDIQWTAPVLDRDGYPQGKPHDYATPEPVNVITDPAKVGVIVQKEVKRLHVALRPSTFEMKLTDACNTRLNKALEKAGLGSTYYFDYGTQEAVILAPVPEKTMSLAQWMQNNPDWDEAGEGV